jgi:hypothetical protein
MKSLFLLLATLIAAPAFANSPRTLDGAQITNGAAVLTLPTTTDTIAGIASTQALTNKTLNFSLNTATNIPVGAIGNGSVLSGSNSGDVTLGTANGLSLTGQALSLGTASSSTTGALTSTDWSTFNSKQAGPLTGDVTTSGAAATLATVNSNVGSFTNANITVNAKGLVTAASNGTGAAPALNGGSGSAESVTASGGVSLSGLTYLNEVWVVGSGGAVTVTKTPSVTACTADGQQLKVHATSATNTVTLQDQSNLASSGLSLNGNWVGGLDSTIILHCDITRGLWVEDARR